MAEKKEYVKPSIIEIEPQEDGGARYRLPYGIAKGLKLNTDGMTPRQVWDMLKGKGINPETAYEDLKNQAQTETKKEKLEEADAQKELDLRNIENVFIRDRLKSYGVENVSVSNNEKNLTHQEIVNKVAGGDKTGGSCVSVALAYIGNTIGYDVLDYRGGTSQQAFASLKFCKEIANLKGVKSVVQEEFNDVTNATKLVKTMESNKDYLLIVGQHAAIVHKNDNGYEYLEMQSTNDNGFKPLTTDVFRYRFGCKMSHRVMGMAYKKAGLIIDCETLGKSNDFKNMLAYINTNTNKQKKGEGGSVK